MKLHEEVHQSPQVFTDIQNYNFSKIFLQNDYGLGIGHCVKITFELPNEEGKYKEEYGGILPPIKNGESSEGPVEFSILGIPTFDGYLVKSIDNLINIISKFKNLPVTVLNDFDVPWVTLQKVKFPKVAKKKPKK